MNPKNSSNWFGSYQPRTYGPTGRAFVELFETELAGIARTRLPRAYEPIVVPASSWRCLLAATRRLLTLQRQLIMGLASSSLERVTALGANPADFPRFVRSERFELDHALDMSRNDVVVGPEGPKFIEFNVGAGVGGALEFEIERRIWQRVRGDAGMKRFVDVSVYGLLSRVLRDARNQPSSDRTRALLVSSLADPAKTPQYFAAQRAMFAEFGVDAEFVDVGDLDALSQDQIDESVALMQFNEREMNESGVSMSHIAQALDQGLIAVPSQTSRLVDSKKTMALLSERSSQLGAVDRALVESYIPWTRVLEDGPTSHRHGTEDLLDYVVKNQDQLVIKSADGYSSGEVFFGNTVDASRWLAVIDTALNAGYYVVQEVVQSVRVPIRIVDSDGVTDVVSANPRICPFHIGGEGTGYCVRFNTAHEPGPVGRASGAMPGCVMSE